jgi:two-component system CheB/CheR fusion protein
LPRAAIGIVNTEIATLFLDRELGIRWFTPATQGLLRLRASDIGRPVSHFARGFTGDDFLEDVREVLQRLVPRTGEVVGDDDRTYIRRILPYRTSDDRIDGVAVTFTDITERKLLSGPRDVWSIVASRPTMITRCRR